MIANSIWCSLLFQRRQIFQLYENVYFSFHIVCLYKISALPHIHTFISASCSEEFNWLGHYIDCFGASRPHGFSLLMTFSVQNNQSYRFDVIIAQCTLSAYVYISYGKPHEDAIGYIYRESFVVCIVCQRVVRTYINI